MSDVTVDVNVKFVVKDSVHRGGTAGVKGEVDLHGFGVIGPDGVEVDWAFPGQRDHAEKVAARLNATYAGRDVVRCVVCGGYVTSNNPDRFPYCKNCFYTGRAHDHLRREQIAVFENALPGARVGVEHTGGGCFWLAIRWDDESDYYILTDGEAGLPVTHDADSDYADFTSGGWGYVGWQVDTDEGDTDEEQWTQMYFNEDALQDPSAGLSNERALLLIRKDLAVRHPERVPTQWFTLNEYSMDEQEYRGGKHRYLSSGSLNEAGVLMTFATFEDAVEMATFMVEDDVAFPLVGILAHEMDGDSGEVTGWSMGYVIRHADGSTSTHEGDYENDPDWDDLTNRADAIIADAR